MQLLLLFLLYPFLGEQLLTVLLDQLICSVALTILHILDHEVRELVHMTLIS